MDVWTQPGCSVSRALLQNYLSSGAWAAPPQRPQTPPGISHLFHRRRFFFSTHAPFLASKRTCWETLKSKSLFGLAGAGDKCSEFLGVEILLISSFVKQNKTYSLFTQRQQVQANTPNMSRLSAVLLFQCVWMVLLIFPGKLRSDFTELDF